MKALRQLLACLALTGCSDFQFGPDTPPDRSFDVRGTVVEHMPQCPRAMLVMIQLTDGNDTVCTFIPNDSFRIPGQQIIFDMSKRTGQKTLMGCPDTLPEMVSVYNLRYPQAP